MLKNVFYYLVALVASMPRKRFNYRLVDIVHKFLYARSMSLSLPYLCRFCAILKRVGDHSYCEERLLRLQEDDHGHVGVQNYA